MKKMFIKYDNDGQIVAIIKPEESIEEEIIPLVEEEEPGIEILEIDEKSKFFKMEPLEIHEAYEVDRKTKNLKKRASKKRK